ncbi:MAG TPA: autotransporter-associated beta strand repeat-containing protein [Thermoguttaceae bacterium]|nr:autotransporter-associated beta strand repeat-containing protein [Thermoguttaceae bacterium]
MNSLPRIVVLALLAGLLLAVPASASDYYWTLVDPASGYVTEPANWGSLFIPGTGDVAYFQTNGLALVDDLHSWSPVGAIYLGNTAAARLDQSGGTVACDLVHVGRSGGTGTLTMTGTLLAPATFSSTATAHFGDGVGNTGTLDMQGYSNFTSTSWSYVGSSGGTGYLTMSDNAVFNSNNSSHVGIWGGGHAELDMSGSSRFLTTGWGHVGHSTNASAVWTMANDAYYYCSGDLFAGDFDHANLDLTMTGSSDIEVGAHAWFGTRSGAATMDMSGTSSIVAHGWFRLGVDNASDCDLTMSGNSTVTTGGVGADWFLTGWNATSTITMSENASISSNVWLAGEDDRFYLGNGVGGNATLEMSGESTFTVNNVTHVGAGGADAAINMYGALVDEVFCSPQFHGVHGWMGGMTADSRVDLTLSDDSLISFSSWMNISTGGSKAFVNLHDNSTIQAASSDLAYDNGVAGLSEATITLHDDSSFAVTGQMNVGTYGGVSEITLTGVGAPELSAGTLCLGQQWGGTITDYTYGTVNVNATNAQVTATTLQIGYDGGIGVYSQNAGTTTVVNAVLLGDADVGAGALGSGILNLNGGTLACPGIVQGEIHDSNPSGTISTVNFNGGTLKATSASSDFIVPYTSLLAGTGAVTLNVLAGGAVIDTNTFDVTLNLALVEDATSTGGGLTKLGDGILTLTGNNAYTGDTIVSGGTLSTDSNTMLADEAALRIALDAVMSLDFTGADTIGGLYLGGVAMTDEGTWGSSVSGATYQNDLYFTGLGMVYLDLFNPVQIPGDADGNQIVDAVDAGFLATNWGVTEGADWEDGDFNGDGAVNALDASILAANWGDHRPLEGSRGVPEPGIFALILGLGLALPRRRTR